MTEPLSILSTKILGEGISQKMRQAGWTLREEEFILEKGLALPPHEKPNDQTVIVYTSAHAIQPLAGNIACLSGNTRGHLPADAEIACTAANATDLAHAILKDGRFTKALFFCAKEHRPELPDILRQAGLTVHEIPVYETIATPHTIDTPFDAVLFFSPSGVDSFFTHNRVPPGAIAFAIGETTAARAREHKDTQVISSPSPTQEALLHCIQTYYESTEK
jgi:uroporphyrinogen-III synthase